MSLRIRLAILGLGVLIGGCGTTAQTDAPGAGQVTAAFKASPPPLAALHTQANRLLGGGPQAFKARLATLRGYPVVVNYWASWCGPCQSEFPIYQRVAVALGRKVAFLGIDEKDADGAASSFLRKFPVTYPSYTDPQAAIAAAIHAYPAYPQTFYFNTRGAMVYDKAGPYTSVSELRKDIRFYLHVA